MRLALLTLLALAGCAPALAQRAPQETSGLEAQLLSGAYEIVNEAGTRKCIVLLRAQAAPGGRAAGVPPLCRQAIPALARVAAWRAEIVHALPRARILLLDAAGATQLDFGEEGPNGAAQAREPAGQALHLRPAQGSSLAERADALVGARPAPRIVQAPPPPDPAAMGRAVGAYALMRGADKDSGCRLRLDAAGPSATEGAAVMIGPCADRGIAFFGPKGWLIADGTLWLTGARGRIAFERARRPGDWDKAPGQGEALFLSRR